MPFVDPTPEYAPQGRMPLGTALPAAPDPSTAWRVVQDSFLSENEVVSFLADRRRQEFPPEPGHNPRTVYGEGTKYDRRYADRFWSSQSAAESRAIMAQIDDEETRRERHAASGMFGTLMDVVASLASPTTLLPGGTFYRGGRAGMAALRSSASVAAAAAGGAAVQEALLHQSQAMRTLEESAVSVGAATLLGALIGSGAGFLSKVEMDRAVAVVRAQQADQAAHLGLPHTSETAARGAVIDGEAIPPVRDPTELLGESGRSALHPEAGSPAGVGAAVTDTRVNEPIRPAGGWLPQPVEHFLTRADPVMRTAFSPFGATRRAMGDLVETAVRMVGHEQGIATSMGVPVERVVRSTQTILEVHHNDIVEGAYHAHRFGESVPAAANLRATVQDWRGAAPDRLSYNDFKREVSVAMRNGDQHAVPEVSQAAKQLRERIYDPLLRRAIAAKLLPEGASVATALTYLNRVWDTDALVRRRPEALDLFGSWMRGEQEHNRAVQRQVRDIWAGIQTHQDMLDKLQRRIATVERRAEDLSTRMSERRVGASTEADRAAALREREGLLREQVEEIETGIEWLKAMDLGPDMRARLAELESDLRVLGRKDRPMTAEELDAAERAETGGILSGDLRVAAEMVTGKRKVPDTPSFLHWVAKQGGIADIGGDARAGLGDAGIPGLVRRGEDRSLFGDKPVMALDDWGLRLAEMDPTRADGQGGYIRYSPDEVMRIMEDAARGNPPAFWLETLPEKTQQGVRAADIAASMEAALDRIGVTSPDMKQVSMLWQGDEVQGRTLADLERALGEMEAAGSPLPMSVQREAAENAVIATRRGMSEARAAVRRAQEAIQSRERRAAAAGGAAGEVEMAGRRRTGRLGVLQERLDGAERLRGVLDDMVGSLARSTRAGPRWRRRSASGAATPLPRRKPHGSCGTERPRAGRQMRRG